MITESILSSAEMNEIAYGVDVPTSIDDDSTSDFG
jgi:hypothetical protein